MDLADTDDLHRVCSCSWQKHLHFDQGAQILYTESLGQETIQSGFGNSDTMYGK